MSLPIFFIHRGDDAYLSYSLKQAKASNPASEVILLGTALNQKYATADIRHEMLDPYMKSAVAFAPLYKHMHVMSYEYNRFCFQRWFLLRDFMRENNLPVCCYIDSDVMLYENVSDPAYSQFSLEFVWTTIVHVDTLDRFCSFITAHFSDPAAFAKLVQTAFQTGNVSINLPLVSDMVVGHLYLEQNKQYIRTNGRYGDRMFDENINFSRWTESLDGKRKKVYLIESKLYARDATTQEFIRLNSLHFQGPLMKEYMPFFFTPNLAKQGSFFFDLNVKQWIPTSIQPK